MAEILQKSANLERSTRHQQLMQNGILTPAGFEDHFTVKGYTVAEDLKPFISHYWVMRWDVPEGEVYRPTEVLHLPVTNVFFTVDEAFVYGVINGTFDYEAQGKGCIAGITFRPGGFYPFLKKSMSQLTAKRTPLSEVIPESGVLSMSSLLAQDDKKIVTTIEALLRLGVPPVDPNIEVVSTIIKAIASDDSLTTVEGVSKRFNKSERTIQLLFTTYIGVGAKWVIMRVRLLEAIRRAYVVGHPNWVEISADLGYSSQAHFINDFKRVVGKSPAQFYRSNKIE